ncbi:MAG: hypothetical protein KF774_20420 [Planctomyces sp.]|nr:hypothetical protein [Planctomyces sp.]
MRFFELAALGLVRACAVLWGLHISGAVVAQEPESSPPPRPDIRVTITPGAVSSFYPGRWGDLRLFVTNSTDEPVEVLATSYVEPESNLQFGHRVWVPANARRTTWHPIRVPSRSPENFDETFSNKGVNFVRTFLTREDNGQSTVLKQDFDQIQQELMLLAKDRERLVALIDDQPEGPPGRIAAQDFLSTMRNEMAQSTPPIIIADRLLPTSQAGIDSLDYLLIADNRIAHDAAGMDSVRSWMYGGGRLWVMLDRVEADVLDRLLGDDFACEVVDRVGLTEIEFETTQAGMPRPPDREFRELPVEHVRVLSHGFETPYTVNGWPAVLVRRCGEGQLVISTLAADGWLRPRVKGDPPPSTGTAHMTSFFPSAPLMNVATGFFQPRSDAAIPRTATEEHLRGFVGYSIPARSSVLGLLAAFTLALGVLGAWLARVGRLELLGVIGPAAGILVGGALVYAGHRQRSAAPATAALVQVVEPMAGGRSAHVTGMAGLFLLNDDLAEIQGTHDGWVMPDMSGLEQSARRLVWTDLGRWRWENLRATPSLRFADVTSSMPLEKPLTVRATFDAQGLKGTLALPDGLTPSDPIIAAVNGRMGVSIGSDGSWTSTAAQTLSPDQFLTAQVLDDEQNRRLQSLRSALPNEIEAWHGTPSLLFWTAPWDTGTQYSRTAPTSGSALVVAPIELTRPPAGTQIVVPSAWVPFREGIGPDGQAPSGLYDYRRRAWSDKSDPTSTWIRFQPPDMLQPYAIRSARVTLQVSGPVGKLELAGFRDGQLVPIQTWVDPIGTLTAEVSDPSVLPFDRYRGFFLRLAAGDPDRPELTRADPDSYEAVSYWRIESLALELRATVEEGGSDGLPVRPAP